MKKIIIIVCLLISISVQAQIYLDKYHEVEYRCEVCGKYIFSWEKELQIERGLTGTISGCNSFNYNYYNSQCIVDSLTCNEFHLNYSIDHICQKCIDKYSYDIEEKMDIAWDRYWEKIKSENREYWLMYDNQNKKSQVKEIEEQIKELELQKLQILHPERKPKE
jgi:hypothetical protein